MITKFTPASQSSITELQTAVNALEALCIELQKQNAALLELVTAPDVTHQAPAIEPATLVLLPDPQ